jgi:hypothetical protein
MRLGKPGINTKIDKAKQFAEGSKSLSKGGIPAGSVRATMNINETLYKRLKIKAVTEGKTIRALLEEILEKHL